MNKLPLKSLLTKIRNGVDLDQHDFPLNSNMLPISRIETIWDGTIDFSRIKYANVTDKDRQRYRLQKGDILFSHINSPEHIGKTAIFESHRSLIHGINLLLLRVNPDQCFPKYLSYYLKTNDVRANFRVRCKKAVNQASLNQDDVTSLEAPLPSLPEQKRIAAILDKADRLRRQRRYAQTLSDSFLQSVFLKMFGDQRQVEIFNLGSLCDVIRDGTHSTPKYVSQGVPFITVKNIVTGELDFQNVNYVSEEEHRLLTKRVKPERGDILVSKDGSIGTPCLVDTDREFSIFVSVALLKPKPETINSVFLTEQIRSSYVQKQISDGIKGIAIRHLHLEDFRELKILVPALPLQQKFATIVQKFERIRRQQREATRQAEHLFQTLLHRAFRGEL